MDTQKIHYCFILSDDQMEFLRSKKYKIDRMECFLSMATLAVRETKLEPISKTQQVKILPGQLMIDNTKLSSGIKTARPFRRFWRLWSHWAFPLLRRLEIPASIHFIPSLDGI